MSNKPLMERYKPSKKILQQHIEQIMLVLAVLLATFPHLLIVWDCQTRLTVISADSLYSLFSTSASVVAGLYGITLTGYISFSWNTFSATTGKTRPFPTPSRC